MRFKSILIGFIMALFAIVPAQAQRGPANGTWELLGEEKVGFASDRDRIEIRQSEAWWREKSFRALRFVAQGGDIKIRRIILNYQNGVTEQLEFQGTMRAGQQVDVPLRGERSYLKAIDFDYASRISFSLGSGGIRLGQATMRVYGENMRGGRAPERPAPPPAPVAGANRGWENLASAAFDRTDSRVEMPVGRREGQFGQVRLVYNGSGGVVVRELSVRFGNKQTQVFPFAERLEDGYSTRGLDLEGDRRFIENVTVILDPRSGRGRGNFILEGNARPGKEFNEPPRRGEGRPNRDSWQLLGRQTVGFQVERDTIRVQQGEGWYRDRGFDKLHFQAENSEIHMRSIRITYFNGHTEDYDINKLIPAGGDITVDLPGARSYIKEVGMTYRARAGYRGQAVVTVYGERAGR